MLYFKVEEEVCLTVDSETHNDVYAVQFSLLDDRKTQASEVL